MRTYMYMYSNNLKAGTRVRSILDNIQLRFLYTNIRLHRCFCFNKALWGRGMGTQQTFFKKNKHIKNETESKRNTTHPPPLPLPLPTVLINTSTTFTLNVCKWVSRINWKPIFAYPQNSYPRWWGAFGGITTVHI